MPRPKQRTPELAEHVLQAALGLLASEGPAALTARRLADAAGTSPAAVYELFGDKAGVLRAVFFSGFEHLARGAGHGGPQKTVGLDELRMLAQRYRASIVASPGALGDHVLAPVRELRPGAGGTSRRRCGATSASSRRSRPPSTTAGFKAMPLTSRTPTSR